MKVPIALRLSKHGFVVFNHIEGKHSNVCSPPPSTVAEAEQNSDSSSPSSAGGEGMLTWIPAHSIGVPVPGHITSEFLADVQATRKSFFPEKVGTAQLWILMSTVILRCVCMPLSLSFLRLMV